MLRTMLLSVALLLLIAVLVKTAIAPVALKQESKGSTADLAHPPTVYGASAVTTSPIEPRR